MASKRTSLNIRCHTAGSGNLDSKVHQTPACHRVDAVVAQPNMQYRQCWSSSACLPACLHLHFGSTRLLFRAVCEHNDSHSTSKSYSGILTSLLQLSRTTLGWCSDLPWSWLEEVRSVTEGSFTCLGMAPCLAKVTSIVGLLGRGSAILHHSRHGRPPQSSQFETTTEAFPCVLTAILDPPGPLLKSFPPRGSRAAFLLDRTPHHLHSTP